MQPGRLLRWKWITREELQRHPELIFVFGDNMLRKGFGGQAKEMRGEPNAVGVPVKWRPSRDAGAYFTDRDLRRFGLPTRLQAESWPGR